MCTTLRTQRLTQLLAHFSDTDSGLRKLPRQTTTVGIVVLATRQEVGGAILGLKFDGRRTRLAVPMSWSVRLLERSGYTDVGAERFGLLCMEPFLKGSTLVKVGVDEARRSAWKMRGGVHGYRVETGGGAGNGGWCYAVVTARLMCNSVGYGR